MKYLKVPIALAFLLSACAETTTTPVSKNQFLLSTSGAPACSSTGTQQVASKMAAVETIRKGYSRFIIQGAQSQNNVSAIQTAPTGAYTTGNIYNNGFGNSYYSGTTTYTGGGVMLTGSHDVSLLVKMLRRGDPGYSSGVDARGVLGEEWEELVEKGITTCT